MGKPKDEVHGSHYGTSNDDALLCITNELLAARATSCIFLVFVLCPFNLIIHCQ